MTSPALRFAPVLLACAVAAYFAFPGYLGLLTQIVILAVFALSYDLLQGHTGIVSLGHAAFFGLGAYSVAILARAGVAEPVLGLLAAGAISAAVALLLSPIVARGNDLTRLLITLGVGAMLGEAANRARGLTGGADGLSDFTIGPVLGLFAFDFAGQTAFLYALAVLVLVYLAMWRITTSPFGLALTGIRENALRMRAIGAPTARHIAVSYALSGLVAGMAGAVLAQTSGFVSLDMLGFGRSAEVMMVATLGGTGSVPGLVMGAAAFGWVKDALSTLSPKYWELALGLVLMGMVLLVRGGIAGGLASLGARAAPAVTAPALEARGLEVRFNSFVAVGGVDLAIPPGARHALIGPNGAGKTTLVQALTGNVMPSGGAVLLGGRDITGLAPRLRVRAGLSRTFQINQLFRAQPVLENIALAVFEREGATRAFWRSAAADRRVMDEAREHLAFVNLLPFADRPVHLLPYGQQRMLEIAIALATRPRVLILDEPAAGVPTTESAAIFERLEALPRDLTLIFVEHDMNLVFRFAERITVLVGGTVLTEGTPSEIAADERVRAVYLGRRGHHRAA